jgi:hypothetical protein
MSTQHARTSRERYQRFVEDYKQRRLDEASEEPRLKKPDDAKAPEKPESKSLLGGKRRE